ncbi:hypothetical protein, partial [Staphylococcus aureus]|uniref:hypothetical protein n=1 Tax=Staphylococcus aureus TaxID=1280 RepID=UPI001EE044E5
VSSFVFAILYRLVANSSNIGVTIFNVNNSCIAQNIGVKVDFVQNIFSMFLYLKRKEKSENPD